MRVSRRAREVLCAFVAILVLFPVAAHAERITVLCSNGLRAVIQELAPQFERATGHQVEIHFSVAAELKKRIDGGEAFDVAILTPAFVDALIAESKARPDSRTGIARSGMALAVKSGAAHPDVATLDVLKATLVASRSIAFAREGAGGVFFTALIQRLGLVDTLSTKLRPVTTGQDVSAAVARGDAQFGVLPLSEILSTPGVELAGSFPSAVQDYAVMVGVIGVGAAARANAAQALLGFLMSPAAEPVVTRRGMERLPTTQ